MNRKYYYQNIFVFEMWTNLQIDAINSRGGGPHLQRLVPANDKTTHVLFNLSRIVRSPINRLLNIRLSEKVVIFT